MPSDQTFLSPLIRRGLMKNFVEAMDEDGAVFPLISDVEFKRGFYRKWDLLGFFIQNTPRRPNPKCYRTVGVLNHLTKEFWVKFVNPFQDNAFSMYGLFSLDCHFGSLLPTCPPMSISVRFLNAWTSRVRFYVFSKR